MEISIDELKDIILNIVPEIEDIDYTDNLIDSGILDSFMVMELIDILEEKFQAEFPPESIIPENFESINSIYEMIAEIF